MTYVFESIYLQLMTLISLLIILMQARTVSFDRDNIHCTVAGLPLTGNDGNEIGDIQKKRGSKVDQ